jgi:hypothetical protein
MSSGGLPGVPRPKSEFRKDLLLSKPNLVTSSPCDFPEMNQPPAFAALCRPSYNYFPPAASSKTFRT